MTLAFPETEEDTYSPTRYRPIAPSGIVATAVIAFAFMAGTGGLTTAESLQQRGSRGYEIVQIPAVGSANVGLRLPVDNLRTIRSAFKPSISDLAGLLGVSRQAIYNWMAGERPSLESADRLEDLAKAADLVAARGVSSPYVLRRKIKDGKSLMEIIRDGGSAQDAARVLIRIVENEAEQREQMGRSMAGRKRPKLENRDSGAPMLDE